MCGCVCAITNTLKGAYLDASGRESAQDCIQKCWPLMPPVTEEFGVVCSDDDGPRVGDAVLANAVDEVRRIRLYLLGGALLVVRGFVTRCSADGCHPCWPQSPGVIEGMKVPVPAIARVAAAWRPHAVGDIQVAAKGDNVTVPESDRRVRPELTERRSVQDGVFHSHGIERGLQARAVAALGNPHSGRSGTEADGEIIEPYGKCEIAHSGVQQGEEWMGRGAADEFNHSAVAQFAQYR